MAIFEKMLDPKIRHEFIEKKKKSYNVSSDELEKLRTYMMSEECTEHIQRLIRGDYYFAQPQQVLLRKGHSHKRRAVYIFEEKESMLMKLMTYVLHEYDGLFSDSLYSFRTHKRAADLFKKISALPDVGKKFVLRCDIRNYYGAIDQEILLSQLEVLFLKEDADFYYFLRWLILRNEFYRNEGLTNGNMAALAGTPLASFFGNLYLLAVDEEMRKQGILYARYSDDIALFTESLEQAEASRQMLGGMLADYKLEYNTEKTNIYMPGEPVELLGMKMAEGHYDISDHSLGKIKWKMTHYSNKLQRAVQMKKMTKEEAMDRMIRRANRYFFGRRSLDGELNWVAWAFPVLTRDKSLREIDAHIQNCIRIAGSGKKTDAKYRVTYQMMKEHGYQNLVHAYHHGYETVEG